MFFYKESKLVTFDPLLAASMGIVPSNVSGIIFASVFIFSPKKGVISNYRKNQMNK